MVPRSWRDDTLALDRPEGRPVAFEDVGRKDFLYHFFKAGPAGGRLRRPSSTGSTGSFVRSLQDISRQVIAHPAAP